MNRKIISSELINEIVGGQKLAKHQFEDLEIVFNAIKDSNLKSIKKVLNWFVFLQDNEIVGWRNKSTTVKIAKLLAKNNRKNPLLLYSLFCPSYKKGEDVFGFRTDMVGETTCNGIYNLSKFYLETKKLGVFCKKPLAIFFDLAIEQPKKIINSKSLKDLEINIQNFKSRLPKEIDFVRLSQIDKGLSKTIGLMGITLTPLPIPNDTFERIVERGYKFYKLFGWTKKQVVERSKVIASSEAMVGEFLKRNFEKSIMLYTPTMLERACVYSGMDYDTDPLPIVFPSKEKYVDNICRQPFFINCDHGVVVTI